MKVIVWVLPPSPPTPSPGCPSSHPSVHAPCAKKDGPQPGPGLPCPLDECPGAAATKDHTGQLEMSSLIALEPVGVWVDHMSGCGHLVCTQAPETECLG